MVEKAELQENLKIGSFVRIADLVNESNGTVCVLYPYQPFVAENMLGSAVINEYLKATDYSADESHWSLVIVKERAVSISTFKRSEKLDILAAHEIQTMHKTGLPKGSGSMNCAVLMHATIAKIEFQNRIYLVLGEIK